MDLQNIKAAVEQALADSKERKFIESVDIAVGLKDVALNDPSKRFRLEIVLPHAPNKDTNIAIVGDEAALDDAKNAGMKILLSAADVEALAKNPVEARKFTKSIDYVLAIPQMMAVVGKNLGRYLGPVGKTPSVLPPNADIAAMQDRYARTCKLRLRQNPVVHARVATRDMPVDNITENIEIVLRELEHKLEQGPRNIKSAYVKTTMGKPVKIGGY